MANDLWRTPQQVFDALDKEFEFVADMAADKENAKCSVFFTEEDDSLKLNWASSIEVSRNFSNCNFHVWLNCPYSDPMP